MGSLPCSLYIIEQLWNRLEDVNSSTGDWCLHLTAPAGPLISLPHFSIIHTFLYFFFKFGLLSISSIEETQAYFEFICFNMQGVALILGVQPFLLLHSPVRGQENHSFLDRRMRNMAHFVILNSIHQCEDRKTIHSWTEECETWPIL